MSYVPGDVLVEILSRLPLESLYRFRSVCKSWLVTIDDPVFLKLNIHGPSYDTNHLLVRCRNTRLYSLSLSSLHFSDTHTKQITITGIDKNILRSGYPRICDLPVASCHGLIFISSSKRTKLSIVWNPFTGESVELPFCHGFAMNRMRPCGCGLGYDSTNNDYKAVRIALVRGHMLEAYVYSLTSNAWRRVESLESNGWRLRVDGHHSFIGNDPGYFAFGALHWIFRKCRYRYPGQGTMKCILAFDVQTETFRNLPLPSELIHTAGRIFLSACGESLCLTCSYDTNYNTKCNFDVWEMGDYTSVDNNLWTNKWSLTFKHSNSCFKLIAYLKKKELILFQEGATAPEGGCSPNRYPGGYVEKFLVYDVKKKRAKTVIIRGDLESFTSQVFPPSLVRLRKSECADDKSVTPERTLKRKRKTANDRLKLNLETVHLPGIP